MSAPQTTPTQTTPTPVREIELDSIILCDDTQSRVGINDAIVEEYARLMESGEVFPPLDVFSEDGSVYHLADGYHREAAARRCGRSTHPARVHAGTARDARLYSLTEANRTHGLRLSNGDKRRRVEGLLRDPEWSQWSNNEIARRAGVSHPTVGRYRRLMDESRSASKPDTTEPSDPANDGTVNMDRHLYNLQVSDENGGSTVRRFTDRFGNVTEMRISKIGRSDPKTPTPEPATSEPTTSEQSLPDPQGGHHAGGHIEDDEGWVGEWSDPDTSTDTSPEPAPTPTTEAIYPTTPEPALTTGTDSFLAEFKKAQEREYEEKVSRDTKRAGRDARKKMDGRVIQNNRPEWLLDHDGRMIDRGLIEVDRAALEVLITWLSDISAAQSSGVSGALLARAGEILSITITRTPIED